MSSQTEQTERTLQNHLQSFARADLDALMEGYAEGADFYTPEGVLHGKEEIRSLFADILAGFPPGLTVEIQQQIINKELAYIVWAGEPETLDIQFATDTMIVRDGKIVQQTFAAQINAQTLA